MDCGGGVKSNSDSSSALFDFEDAFRVFRDFFPIGMWAALTI